MASSLHLTPSRTISLSQISCSSPYLDRRLFACSEPALNPTLRMRPAGTRPIQLWAADDLDEASAGAATAAAAAGGGGGGGTDGDGTAAAAAAAAGAAAAAAFPRPPPLLQLEAPPTPAVTVHGRTVARRVLHLFHPTDPFCCTVVQSFMQPTTVDLYYRR